MGRIAVVLFNLGGPDGPAAVRPFLRNLFSDRAILPLPAFVRLPLAETIARARERLARANYDHIGGASPLNAETERQAGALQEALALRRPADELKTFIAMRYWRPTTAHAAEAVAAFAPDEVVLLPLYPQFSTTTTASSWAAWRASYRGAGRVHPVCCYFDAPGTIAAHAARIRRTWNEAGAPARVRLLFSAHGLPERTSAAGDPYRWQVEATCAAVADELAGEWDWRVCYQSRVGPLKWIGPSVIEELERAAADGLGVLIDPIAFVSEHVETLVELDRDYREVADRLGVTPYLRAPALGTEPAFIESLADLAEAALVKDALAPGGSGCGLAFRRCPFQAEAAA